MDAMGQEERVEAKDQDATPSVERDPVAPAAAGQVEPTVRIEATLAHRLNLADFQNAVPLIRELVVINEHPVDLRDLELSLSAEPAFLAPRQWRIDLLPAGQRLQLSDVQVRLDGPLFSRLAEAEQATVLVALSSVDATEPHPAATTKAPIASARHAVELLARDEWGGHASMPEMLAGFVQPNEPQVEKLLRRAADTLEASGQQPSLNGYGDGPKHAWGGIWFSVPPIDGRADHRPRRLPVPRPLQRCGKADNGLQIVDGGRRRDSGLIL